MLGFGPFQFGWGCGPPSGPASPGRHARRKSSEKAGLEAPTAWKVKLLSGVWLLTTLGTNSPGQNTLVGSLFLLQGIFPTQGSNPGLPHCRGILYHLSCKGSPRILEQVAYPFSRGSSQSRNRTGVSCIPGGFFTN